MLKTKLWCLGVTGPQTNLIQHLNAQSVGCESLWCDESWGAGCVELESAPTRLLRMTDWWRRTVIFSNREEAFSSKESGEMRSNSSDISHESIFSCLLVSLLWQPGSCSDLPFCLLLSFINTVSNQIWISVPVRARALMATVQKPCWCYSLWFVFFFQCF